MPTKKLWIGHIEETSYFKGYAIFWSIHPGGADRAAFRYKWQAKLFKWLLEQAQEVS